MHAALPGNFMLYTDLASHIHPSVTSLPIMSLFPNLYLYGDLLSESICMYSVVMSTFLLPQVMSPQTNTHHSLKPAGKGFPTFPKLQP